MKIMIDATSLAREITGIENYTKNLVEQMIDLNNGEHDLYLLFRGGVPDYLADKKGFHSLNCPFQSQLLCEQIWIPLMKWKYRPNVIHFPAFPPSILVRKNVHFTVFDATMWKYPETTSLKNKLYMRPLSERGIKIAKKVYTISESAKNDLSEVFPILEKKLYNMGLSISPSIKENTNKIELENTVKKFKLPTNFFLTVGSLEPRKNLIFLIKVFIEFKKKTNSDYKLVITGRSAWGSNEIKELMQRNNMEEDIIITGYVSDQKLINLYSLADYFIFPSIYEGFGLPVLEAMACGTPVITSNRSSLPEVAGNAALYFDPQKPDQLLELLSMVDEEENIQEELSKKGLEQRKKFSWQKVAKKTFDEYIN